MKISDEAMDYILKRGSVVTINFSGIGGCCVPVYIPVAYMEKPENPDSYRRVDQDGILIYYPNSAVVDEEAFGINLISSDSHAYLEVVGINTESQ
ncbi:MAG TPA: CC/Se motif family (seleno)protein [Desulfobacteria bacterium]|nr:CC/Se motif family (seleno)protein [Desulfobacteria bacterium]